MTTGYTVIALSSGVATVLNKNGNVVVFGSKGIPEWASEHHRVQSEASANSKSETDDIPF
jgi:hypothetical protein